MLESLIVLRDALYELPGGFKDTTRTYRSDREAGGCPTSIEHVSDAQMFVERALFNRNSLVGVLPENVFSARLAVNPERQLVFRCALAEFGASAFQGKHIDLEELAGDQLQKARESYGNSPLRLSEKGDDKLRRDFCHGWPPIDYDNKTVKLITAIRKKYTDVFNDAELDRFLERIERDQERYRNMAPGADAFKKIMQTERGQDTLLWGLDLWDRFEDDPALGKPPVEELVGRLADAFRHAGYHEATVRYFENTTLESFDAYRESFYTCSSLWNARKGAMIYNVIISAFFGPKSALKNCYADELAHTEIAPFVPRELSVAGALERGHGEALIRQVLPGDTAYTVRLVNLDALPERASELIVIIGREFGGEVRPLPASQDAAAAFAASASAIDAEDNESFYPTDLPADSARHVGIYAIDGKVYAVDLASSNGTIIRRVTGEAVYLGTHDREGEVPSALLKRGDRIYLGDSEFDVL